MLQRYAIYALTVALALRSAASYASSTVRCLSHAVPERSVRDTPMDFVAISIVRTPHGYLFVCGATARCNLADASRSLVSYTLAQLIL